MTNQEFDELFKDKDALKQYIFKKNLTTAIYLFRTHLNFIGVDFDIHEDANFPEFAVTFKQLKQSEKDVTEEKKPEA